jgi:hypothetical protein
MKAISIIGCDAAMELMSPFIDSMVTSEEAECLRSHLSDCAPCVRQMQSYISLRNLMAGVEPVPVPEDLQLDSRVRLSRARLPNGRDRWQARVDNILRPLAVPAFSGVALTLVGFVILLSSFVSTREVHAGNEITGSVVMTYEPPRGTDSTIQRFSSTMSPELDQTLSVQTDVSQTGRVVDYNVIGGTRSPGVDQWLQEVLLLAQFRPATSRGWGTPVPSRVILSFVNVRG